MRLATISSQEENDKVAMYIKNSGLGGEYFWIGASDLAQQGKYVWMSTGEPVVYSNWLAGEPNHLTENGEVEHCVHLWEQSHGFTWNDKICSTLFNFICEM
ncbi:C-type lectin mannose-binding isoform-like [Thrips palmi]|uniref:C-type lectin mannose-binding isoform-like n=1 Tax=Thrips palmi TaxID=161013 RepID=A0A6P8YI72_THRPL|nr:C-type lectin mannose-binding isoform-like [Thrips palmi]